MTVHAMRLDEPPNIRDWLATQAYPDARVKIVQGTRIVWRDAVSEEERWAAAYASADAALEARSR